MTEINNEILDKLVDRLCEIVLQNAECTENEALIVARKFLLRIQKHVDEVELEKFCRF